MTRTRAGQTTFAEAGRMIRQREARGRLIDMLGGCTLTPALVAAIVSEQAGRHAGPKKARRVRAP